VGGGTLEGSLIGTPFYMSPEQAVGRPDVDHRSDLWSLGIILYRALTGRRPFASQALLESVVEIASAPIPPPSSIQPELGPEVDAFFERALARKPADRFESAKEMAKAFGALRGARSNTASEAAPPALPAPAILPEVAVELDVAPAQPSRRWGLTAFAAAAFAALGIGGWIAVRPAPSQSPEQAVAPTTAAPTAPAVESAAAVPAAATTETPVQSATAAPAASALPVPGARPGAPVPIPGKRKGKRDVGY
jgi:serine/threonine-protein kinase